MDELLRWLSGNGPAGEGELCRRLKLTREELAARLDELTAQGYRIRDEGGLRLSPAWGSLLPGDILTELKTERMGRGTILYAPEVGSTNTELKRAAAAEALAEGSLSVCDRQTGGRGRLARAWTDAGAAESLACSVLIRPKLPPEKVPLYTLVVAVAAAEAIGAFGPAAGIKWPNDVVIGVRKCVGILCEAVRDPAGETCVVAGAGFNVNQRAFAGELEAKATSLYRESGRQTDRRTFLCRYLLELERAAYLLETEGWAALYPAYAARSVTLRSRVKVESAAESFTGTAESIDESGALYVRADEGGLRRVLSGDVSVRGVMGYV